MIVFAMLALQTAAVTAAPPPDPAPDPAIVVTGRRLSDYAAALDACIAARCSPRRDIVASIRYAEALFRSGDYRNARAVLSKSVERNRSAASVEPVALSQLYIAQANVAAHFGEQREVARATYNSLIAVRDNMPATAPEVLSAELFVADYRVRIGDFAGAQTAYAALAPRARAAGSSTIADAADLHRAWVLHVRHRDGEAKRLLADLAAAPEDARRTTRVVARVLAARIARAAGDQAGSDALIAAIAREPTAAAPVLVWSPPTPKPTDPVFRDPTVLTVDRQTKSSDYAGLRWVDIGFGIRPDGSVDTPEFLRGSRAPESWAAPLLRAIAQRRYTATASAGADSAHYRVERYTFTADFVTPTNSNIRRRGANPHYEQIDLTDGAPPARPDA